MSSLAHSGSGISVSFSVYVAVYRIPAYSTLHHYTQVYVSVCTTLPLYVCGQERPSWMGWTGRGNYLISSIFPILNQFDLVKCLERYASMWCLVSEVELLLLFRRSKRKMNGEQTSNENKAKKRVYASAPIQVIYDSVTDWTAWEHQQANTHTTHYIWERSRIEFRYSTRPFDTRQLNSDTW